MSAKSIRFHELARYKMFADVNMLADAVGSPKGKATPVSTRKPKDTAPEAELTAR